MQGRIQDFLEMGVHMCIGVGLCFADFIYFFLKYPMKMKLFGLSETKLFHLHRIFKKTGAGRMVRANPLNSLWVRHCIMLV